jgi:hypothetical protein
VSYEGPRQRDDPSDKSPAEHDVPTNRMAFFSRAFLREAIHAGRKYIHVALNSTNPTNITARFEMANQKGEDR